MGQGTALPWFRDRSQDNRRQAERALQRAIRLHRRERPDQAIEALERAVALAATHLDLRVNVGSLYYQLALTSTGDERTRCLERSSEQFRYVLGLDPNHAAASLNLAAALDALGEHEESLRLLESLARARPQHRDVHYNLAVALGRAGRHEEALEAALAELRLAPDHAQAKALAERLRALLDPDGETR